MKQKNVFCKRWKKGQKSRRINRMIAGLKKKFGVRLKHEAEQKNGQIHAFHICKKATRCAISRRSTTRHARASLEATAAAEHAFCTSFHVAAAAALVRPAPIGRRSAAARGRAAFAPAISGAIRTLASISVAARVEAWRAREKPATVDGGGGGARGSFCVDHRRVTSERAATAEAATTSARSH